MYTNQAMPIPALSELDTTEQFIQGISGNGWIIRIEHAADVNPVHTSWQQWGKPMYLGSDKKVVDLIVSCHAAYPMHSIRLHAEKMQPCSKLIYCVHKVEPEIVDMDIIAAKQHTTSKYHIKPVILHAARSMRTWAWQILTITGLLLASLLYLEESAL